MIHNLNVNISGFKFKKEFSHNLMNREMLTLSFMNFILRQLLRYNHISRVEINMAYINSVCT